MLNYKNKDSWPQELCDPVWSRRQTAVNNTYIQTYFGETAIASKALSVDGGGEDLHCSRRETGSYEKLKLWDTTWMLSLLETSSICRFAPAGLFGVTVLIVFGLVVGERFDLCEIFSSLQKRQKSACSDVETCRVTAVYYPVPFCGLRLSQGQMISLAPTPPREAALVSSSSSSDSMG